MAKNVYIKPTITVVETDYESALMDMSQTQPGRGLEGQNPNNNEAVDGEDMDAKGFWGSTWED